MANKKTTCKPNTAKPAKVYKDEDGKVRYKQSTDKVGDVLINQAGVKYTIIGERFHAPSGYDDGKLKVRTLQVKVDNGQTFEVGDNMMKYCRENKILTREKKSPKISKSAQTSPKTTSKPADATSYTVKQGRTSKTFKTKSEAQICASQSNKKATITKTNKKPTHKIVKFTARV